MSAVEDLRRAREQMELEKAMEAAKKAERERDKLAESFVMQFGPALMDELGMQPGHSGRYPFVTLNYRGCSRRWDKAGYGDAYIATSNSLAEWMDKIDVEMARWDEEREVARHRVVGMERNGFALNLEMDAVGRYRLREFDDVREALARWEARRQAAEDQEKHERRAAIKADLQGFVAAIKTARSAMTREALREVAEWRERHQYSDYQCRFRVVAKRLDAALEDGWEWMRLTDEACEAKRAQAEREAFRPFVFYRAYYGIVAQDGGEMFVETQSIDALHEPPVMCIGSHIWYGVWQPVRGVPPVDLIHLVKVEHVAVTSVEELPGWCPKRETEWGKIRVAPEGAEGTG